jgi:hypothetical protein
MTETIRPPPTVLMIVSRPTIATTRSRPLQLGLAEMRIAIAGKMAVPRGGRDRTSGF